ncbi:MAG TPA: PLP-dependent aminotransferase family protein, partial [Tepidisphaeraceae bacterium]|nr:PLP-dependent aminotransferase family protein [Tepidisphaeraceae bacterium]
IPLIEDEVCGDLAFGNVRPPAAKSYDKKGLVLLCSSFSKTLAPGYRIGWIAAGRYKQKVEELKYWLNAGASAPAELGIAEFLANGGYDRHLRAIRRTYSRQLAQVRNAVSRYFPAGTRATRPTGGFMLWVEMPEQVDAFKLYQKALRRGIGLATGAIFTNSDQYRNCIRLNAAFWSEQIEHALEIVGCMATGMTS